MPGKKKLYVLLILAICAFFGARGQDIVMSNGTISQCGGTFYDSGGDSSAYLPNQTLVYTICADVPGQCVSLSFTQFSLENGFDFLYVFNGPSTSSPLLGKFTGYNIPPAVTATSGCLTIKFVSDYTVCTAGWKATLSCSQCPVNGCPTCNGGSPPPNDACSGARNLGQLAVPAACPNGTGTVAVINTSNLCATAEVPYNALQGCKPVGNMATPAADVWYKFTITAPILNVTINGMITPEVGLYSGTGCNNLVPRGCAIGGGGLLNANFSGLSPGTYYLQVSGGTLNDQCNFSLSLQNNNDCQGCVVQSALTVNPPPANGIYLSGQTVNFCLNITGFNPTSANWLHGVVPHFGPGWDVSSLVALPPNSCSGNGTWAWYNNTITSSANGAAAGPGFFYETSAGNSANVADNNPGNNFGDNISNSCNLNFCWRISTQPIASCVNAQNLNVFIDTYADGESGSWTSTACTGDPVNDLYATLACCTPPAVAPVNAACSGLTGSATGTGQGNGPWIFTWKNSAGVMISQSAAINTTHQVLNLLPGTYTLTTEDVNGCESTTTFAITQPQPLGANISTTATKCALNNGIIDIIGSGGTAPYTYSKDNGTTYQALAQFKNLAPGLYTVVIKDSQGCTYSTQVNVGSSTVPVIASLTHTDVTCFGGTDGNISVSASGGSSPYSFKITNGGFSVTQAISPFNNLGAGTYQVVATDVFGCTAASSVTITQPAYVDLLSIPTPSDCNLNNGQIVMNVLSGSVGTLLYSITNGTNFQTSNSFDSLAPGIYNVIIQDANGCLVKDTVIVNTVNAPRIDSIVTRNLSCYHSANGELSIHASGGVGILTYSINNGVLYNSTTFYNTLTAASYAVSIKDANNCRIFKLASILEPLPVIIKGDVSPSTTCGLSNASAGLHPINGTYPLQFSMNNGATWVSDSVFLNLPSGNVTFMVRDSKGCQNSRTYVINPSTSPTIDDIDITDVLCFNTNSGSVNFTINNGTPPLQFSLDTAAGYQSADFFTNMVAGNYTITVVDDKGCWADSAFTIQQPQKLSLAANTINTTCSQPNGSISLTAGGGVAPYTYSIDGGGNFANTNAFSNLLPGNYKAVIKDANGCEEATTVLIADEPGPRIINTSYTPQLCDGVANASVTITAVSGTGTLQFSADSGATFVAAATISNLYGGTHVLMVKDVNGCTDSAIVAIPIYHSPGIDAVTPADLTCNGASNGSILINASGGNGALSYSNNNGISYSPSGNFTSLSAGTYLLIVSDSNSCMARDTVQLTEPDALIAAAQNTHSICNLNNASIELSVNGGTPIYFYSINNSALSTDSVFDNLPSGLFQVAVTDVNGCYDSLTVNIPSLPSPVIQSLTALNNSCYQSGNGSLIIQATGTGILSFSLDSVIYQSSGTFDSLDAGSYTIYVTDTNNCLTTDTISISEPDEITATISPTDANCSQNNGSLTINASGGSGSLLFAFNHSGSFSPGNNFTNLSSGNYTITVRDSLQCIIDFTGSVSNINGAGILAVNFVENYCHGDSLGEIDIIATGGTGPLSYSIDNGINFLSTHFFSGLPAGQYDIVVRDTVGCSTTASQEITQPDELKLNVQSDPATCALSNGTIFIMAEGGTGTYLYSMDSVTFQASNSFPGLAAGTYYITVKDSNKCTTTVTVPVVNLSAPVISGVSSISISCAGVSSGSISVTAGGGAGNLKYSIDNGWTFQSSHVFDSLAAGNYQVVVSDANNCIDDTLIIITSPPAVNAVLAVTDANCNFSNGSISIQANGGTGSLLFSFNGSGNFSATDSFPSLAAGNYTIDVRDSSGCISTFNTIVNTVNGPAIDSIFTTDILCNGAETGAISIQSSGGTGNLLYSIDNGAIYMPYSSFSQLSAGNYDIKIKDSIGCITSGNALLHQPSLLTLSHTYTSPSCGQADGSILLNATGGTGSYLFSADSITFNSNSTFNNLVAGSYTFYVEDSNHCVTAKFISLSNLLAPHINTLISKDPKCYGLPTGEIKIFAAGGTGNLQYSIDNGASYSAQNVFSNLMAGFYSISVKDQNNCKNDTVYTINQPGSLILNAAVTPETCSNGNGRFILTASGGTAPFLFSSDGSLTFTSANVFNNRQDGTYYVAVKDGNGCKTADSLTIENLTGPVINTFTKTDVSCYSQANGSVTIHASGGNGLLTYTNNLTGVSQTDSVFTQLGNGNFTFTVSDTNMCSDAVSLSILQPPAFSAALTSSNPSCNGFSNGSVSITPSGGVLPYSIVWSTGVTGDFSLNNLSSGSYSYTVTDQNLCEIKDSVNLTQPLTLVVTHTSANGSCAGSANAAATVTVTGGTPPYLYQWSPNSSNTAYANNLSAGNYSVTVRDQKGCIANYSITITNPTPIIALASKKNVSCAGGSNGKITLAPSGGYAPYSIYWDNGSTSAVLDSLEVGIYSAIITDNSGCTIESTDTITAPTPISFHANISNVKCYGNATGIVSIVATGGVSPYTYIWNSGQTSATITNVPAGIYAVTITDANLCDRLAGFTVNQPTAVMVQVPPGDTLCIGQQTQLFATASGGYGAYTFTWSNGSSNDTLLVSPVLSTAYSLIATDSSGCRSVADTSQIFVFPPLNIMLSGADTLCAGQPVSLSAIAGGGNGGPYAYNWQNGNTSSQITVHTDSSAYFIASITDNCTIDPAVDSVFVTVNPLPQFAITPINAEGCIPLQVNFANSANSPTGTTWLWNFNDGSAPDSSSTPSHVYDINGSYSVSIVAVTPEQCSDSITLADAVHAYPLPVADFSVTPETTTILHPIIDIKDNSTLGWQWYYEFGDGQTSNEYQPSHSYADTGRFVIMQIVSTEYQCTDTSYREIIIKGEFTLYIPNAFTPNNDGKNDLFFAQGFGVTDIQMEVYNRWGNRVYSGENRSANWDGRMFNGGSECPQGTYVYKFKVKDMYGKLYSYDGRVTLIR